MIFIFEPGTLFAAGSIKKFQHWFQDTIMDRRDFIKMLGLAGTSTVAYAACSAYISDALAGSTLVSDLLSADSHCTNGSLKDIEHVVILMQENRSFDHYYGTLRGIRGFGDPRPMNKKDGKSVWLQDQKNVTQPQIPPYHLPKATSTDTDSGSLFLQDPEHDYSSGIRALNKGYNDQWIPHKDIVSMAHYKEQDIPLYFQLAKAFTICDAYYCSHNGGTDTNRSYFWTGTSRGRTSNDQFSGTYPAIKKIFTGRTSPDWLTYPEKLEVLSIDWKVYQEGTDGNPFTGNFEDNTLTFFPQYHDKNSKIYEKSQRVNSVLRTHSDKPSQFEQDVLNDRLPEVSWIVAPEAFSEHPKYPPHFGEYYVNEILRALLANKKVWHKTALLITYDENGGFFDHLTPPTPPLDTTQGLVSKGINIPSKGVSYNKDTEYSNERYEPIGMGARVPMLIISPWTTGGRVCSEVFDTRLAFVFSTLGCAHAVSRWETSSLRSLPGAVQLPEI